MNFDVKSRTILYCRHGSHAYGLNNASSDEDFRGVCIEPIEFVVGYAHNFEQSEQHSNIDCTIFGLRKFAKLAADANPNVIEILFVEPEDIIDVDSQFGQWLLNARQMFLTKKAFNTFGGYAKGQLKRLENHRQWIISPPKPPPTREEFGLPSMPVIPSDQIKAAFSAITKKLDDWNFQDMSDIDRADRIAFINAMAEVVAEMNLGSSEQWKSAGRVLGFETNFLEMLDKERTHKNLKEQYAQYEHWLKNRNPKRFATEQACLCDTKHASHLIRLYYECIDLLNGKGLTLKRPKDERKFLMDIKEGVFGRETYSIIMKEKEVLEKALNEAHVNSKLPWGPDVNAIDALVRKMYVEYWDRVDGSI